MRQHVNPLSRFFQLPRKLSCPDDLFEDCRLPIHLDIGCGRGRFLLELASLHSDCNYLGIEIRKPLVIAAEKERNELDLKNLRFLFCNANVSLEDWLLNSPEDLVQKVSIQFPDPWFKRKHIKRRLLQPSLLISIASALKMGRELFIQSDLLLIIDPMVALIEFSGCFDRVEKSFNWLNENPWNICTERESYVMNQGLPVYRMLYIRNNKAVPKLIDFQKEFYEIN